MELEKRIAALELEVQELQRKSEWRQLDKKNILDALAIEAQRIQEMNETSTCTSEIRANAQCIAELGRVFSDITRTF